MKKKSNTKSVFSFKEMFGDMLKDLFFGALKQQISEFISESISKIQKAIYDTIKTIGKLLIAGIMFLFGFVFLIFSFVLLTKDYFKLTLGLSMLIWAFILMIFSFIYVLIISSSKNKEK